MNLKIVGVGYDRRQILKRMIMAVASKLGINVTIEEISEVNQIVDYPTLIMPALIIDNKIVCTGRIPDESEFTVILLVHMAEQTMPDQMVHGW